MLNGDPAREGEREGHRERGREKEGGWQLKKSGNCTGWKCNPATKKREGGVREGNEGHTAGLRYDPDILDLADVGVRTAQLCCRTFSRASSSPLSALLRSAPLRAAPRDPQRGRIIRVRARIKGTACVKALVERWCTMRIIFQRHTLRRRGKWIAPNSTIRRGHACLYGVSPYRAAATRARARAGPAAVISPDPNFNLARQWRTVARQAAPSERVKCASEINIFPRANEFRHAKQQCESATRDICIFSFVSAIFREILFKDKI